MLLKASRAAERYDDAHRAYCKEKYEEVADDIINRGAQMYQSDMFEDLVARVKMKTDKVTKVFNTLAQNAISAIEAVSNKIVSWNRILFNLQGLSMFHLEYLRKRNNQDPKELIEFSSWNKVKIDLRKEVRIFFSYQLTNHTIKCLKTIGV